MDVSFFTFSHFITKTEKAQGALQSQRPEIVVLIGDQPIDKAALQKKEAQAPA